MKKLFFKTLGCKVNQCESEAIESALLELDSGFISCEDGKADIVVVNTCTVTSKAAMQSRQAVRRAIRNHPGAQIVVTGCHAQTSPGELAAIEGVDIIVGNREKHRIPQKIIAGIDSNHTDKIAGFETANPTNETSHHRFEELPGIAHGGRTRPFLKIQDGCDAFCTYCIVPYARGRSRSLPVDQVLYQIEKLGQLGYREVVLTGIHIGCYGKDLSPSTKLYDLLSRIRDAGAIERVRISSIEPAELSDEIINFGISKEEIPGRLCPHFHIPLQSGDNDILKRMHRPYDRDYFRELVLSVVDRMPDAAIGVDTLIGFPGESDDAFQNTFELIRSLPVAYLHVFPFSARKATPAYTFSDPVQPSVIKQRCENMRRLGADKRQSFYKRWVGKPSTVLVEETRDRNSSFLKGLTDNYIPIRFEGPDDLFNTFQQVEILRIASDGVPVGAISE